MLGYDEDEVEVEALGAGDGKVGTFSAGKVESEI